MGTIKFGNKVYDQPLDKDKAIMEILTKSFPYIDISIGKLKKHAKYNPITDTVEIYDPECQLAYTSLLEGARYFKQVEAFKERNVPHMIALLDALFEIEEKGRAKARK
jgi:hypothetical protein